jgi:hypothetical protein
MGQIVDPSSGFASEPLESEAFAPPTVQPHERERSARRAGRGGPAFGSRLPSRALQLDSTGRELLPFRGALSRLGSDLGHLCRKRFEPAMPTSIGAGASPPEIRAELKKDWPED